MARREMTYYDSRDGRRPRTSRRGFFSFFDWLMVAASITVAILVTLSWMARWIPPSSYGFMSAAGLFVPVLFVANFMCLLYWVIRWKRGVYLPLAVFVIGLWSVTMFFRPSLTQSHTDHSKDRSLVGVTTYNVRGMVRSVGGSSQLRSSMSDVVAVIDSLKPDILCLQEFASTELYPASDFERALPSYHYKSVRYNADTNRDNYGWGNAIFSKFPIAGSGHIDFSGTNNSILWADIAAGRDTVRVFCAHLQTTAIKASDERYIVDMDFVSDDTRTSRVRGMVGRLTRNYIIRAAQADTLASRIAASPHPVIVCGDFNDTPASWAYRRIARGLRDSFREAGRGYGYTYRGFFNLLRIDYMLHSPTMECIEYVSPSFDNSDHNPVSVKLRMN
jgi:endonuclease/exonuclease/phosphatase family metal-dependent hydrolase